jgi:hypothetical protein
MRFLTLLKKELREALPWVVLAAFILAFCGALYIASNMHRFRDFNISSPRSNIRMDYFGKELTLRDIGLLLLYTSCGLGLVLAVRQFLIPAFQKTWAFAVHRSISRTAILLAKFSVAIIALILSCGIIWTLFYWYATNPGMNPVPPRQRIFGEGWILITLGLVVYFGAVLSALSTARWVSTKMFGLAFATVGTFLLLTLRASLTLCLVTIIISLVILVSQIIHTFLNREF